MAKRAILALAFILAVCFAAEAGSIIVIANKNVPASTLSKDDMQRIFLGKKTSWDNGKKIVPVVQKSGHVHEGFLKNVLDKNVSQFDTYWKEAVFTGKGRPPKSVGGDADVVQFVGGTEGAVGYIDSDTPHADVKKIDVK